MNYFILGLFSLLVLTACTTTQEEYYGPYGSPLPPRAEMHYEHSGQYHSSPNQRGQVHPRGPRSVESHATTPSVNNHSYRQGRVAAPHNAHGHNQDAVSIARKEQQSASGRSNTVNQPIINNEQTQSTVHGHN